MLWLHIHFPRLALEAEFMADNRPIAQLLLKPGSQVVLQCNEQAIAQGVHVGMNKKTAFCLLEDCTLADYDTTKEQTALNQLALLCYHQAAQISLIEPQALLLELGSMLPLFNGLKPYWGNLRQRLVNSGFSFSMSTGHTPKAARILAEADIELCSDDSSLSEQTLLALSVEQLHLPAKIVQKLTSMGISQYGQLKNTPRKELGYRFGSELVEHLHKLENDSQPPTSYTLPKRFQQTLHLNYEAEHAQGLLFPVKRALLSLEAYLRSHQLLCEKLLIKLEHRDGQLSLLTVPSVRGSYLQNDWLALLQIKLEHTKLVAPVVSITLRAKGFLPMQGEHKDLIGDRHLQANADRMHSLLLARLGNTQVKILRAEADPRPEVASQLIDSQSADSKNISSQNASSKNTDYQNVKCQNVKFQNIESQNIETQLGGQSKTNQPKTGQSKASQLKSGTRKSKQKKPATNIFSKKWPSFLFPYPKQIQPSQYQLISGPERMEGGWWDAESIRRDYYIAEKDGQTCWLFRRDDGHWFLHGVFS